MAYIFPSWTLIFLKAAQASFLLQSPGPVLQHAEAPLVQCLVSQGFTMVFAFC